MIPALREEFNRNYSPEKYCQFLDALDPRLGALSRRPTRDAIRDALAKQAMAAHRLAV